MKKLILMIAVLITLCGCKSTANNGQSSIKKACKYTDSSMSINYVLESKDGQSDISKMNLTIEIPTKLVDGKNLNNITFEDKKEIEDALFTKLNLKKDEANISFTKDNISVIIKLYGKGIREYLTDSNNESISLDSITKRFAKNGVTCK